jgi:hypothetical protein
VFIRLFQGSSKALKVVVVFRVPAVFQWIHWWTGSHTERWWRCSETGFPSRGRKNRQRLTSVWHATHPLSLIHVARLFRWRRQVTPFLQFADRKHPNTQMLMISNTSSHSLIYQSHIVAYKSPQQHTPVCLIDELMQWQACVMELDSIQRMWRKNDGCLAVLDFPPIPKYSDYHILQKGIVMSCSCKGVWSLHNVLFLDTTVMIAQSPVKKTKEKAHNSFSQWPLSTVFRSLHLLDKQLNRRSSSSLNVRLVVICDCTAMNKKSVVSTELVSSPDTEQKLTRISSPQSRRSLILWRSLWRSCIFPNQHKCDLDALQQHHTISSELK